MANSAVVPDAVVVREPAERRRDASNPRYAAVLAGLKSRAALQVTAQRGSRKTLQPGEEG